MPLRVNNNTAALIAYRDLAVTDGQMDKSLETLSSGFRINRSGDDAAGRVIGRNLCSQIGRLNSAVRSALDSVAVVQTAKGALTQVTSMLQRMRDLTVQAGNGSNGTDWLTAAQAEVTQLATSIDDIADRTTSHGIRLFDAAKTLNFQVGADTLNVSVLAMDTTSLTIGATGVAVGKTGTVTTDALAKIDVALDKVTTFGGTLGASQNRLERTITNLSVTAENLTASASRIRDSDMARQMTTFTKSQS